MVFEVASVALIVATFFFAGSVKGITGLGLPPIVLGVLAATIGLQPAKALILVPTFFTNVFQACAGGHGRRIVARTWPFLAAATVMIGLGSWALHRIETRLLSFALGLVLVMYGVMGLCKLRLRIGARWAKAVGLVFGTANGMVTGLTGTSSVPGVFYLQSIGLDRDELLQGMGILFSLSTIGLALTLGMDGLLTKELGLMSAVALIPAMLGMVIGQRICRRIPEAMFRAVMYASLALLGCYTAASNLPI